MSNEALSVVARDNNTIVIYDTLGNMKNSIFVTSGQIIGQPYINGTQIIVNHTEGGQNYMSVFNASTFNFVNKVLLA